MSFTRVGFHLAVFLIISWGAHKLAHTRQGWDVTWVFGGSSAHVEYSVR